MHKFFLFTFLAISLLLTSLAQVNHFVNKTILHNNNIPQEKFSEEDHNSGIIQSNPLPSSISTTDSGLVFQNEYVFRTRNSSNSDIIQLIGLNDKAHALQFRLQVNKAEDDSTFLIFESIEKGSDVNDTTWVLVYNVIRGPILPNGASKDEVYVLLINQAQSGGLQPGDYEDLLKVNYKVTDIPEFPDTLKSSIKITHTSASTYEGFPIDITPSRDALKILIMGIINVPRNGLVFVKDTVYRLEDDSYTDILQIKNLSHKAQAIQFRLLVNKQIDDKVILTFQSLEKGSDIIDPSWVLSYNVFRGPLTGNGASVDEIYVLIHNLGQNNGLHPGDHTNLLKVNYRVADLPALQDSIKSSIKISHTEASTYEGFPIDITPSHENLTVIALNRVGFYGDVNGDGCLDVLDLVMVVDHIVGRDSLETDEFERADIAPWLQGSQYPNPDGVVNVQDLSLLQNIILTGYYPNGTQINDCNYSIVSKINGNEKVTLYVNNNGITAYINSDIEIVGVQMEFTGVLDDPHNMTISTDLGQGYYHKGSDLLRVLLYDRKGEKMIQTGEHLLADMPFNISNPERIKIEKLIIIDINRQKLVESEVEVIYGNPPTMPTDYILYQNYPNPFNPSTTIEYSIPQKTYVILTVYDILGHEIAVLVNGEQERGNYSHQFNGVGLATGIYFYRIQAGPFIQTKKMMLMK